MILNTLTINLQAEASHDYIVMSPNGMISKLKNPTFHDIEHVCQRGYVILRIINNNFKKDLQK